MNPIVLVTVVLACFGIIDRVFGKKIKIATAMEQGMAQCGELLIDICGIYVVTQNFSSIITKYGEKIQFYGVDPSTLIACVLASDMGALSLCQNITKNVNYGTFSGTVIAGTLGGLVSFFIPIYIQTVEDKDRNYMIRGFVYGMLVLPVTIVISGILWNISPIKIIVNICPVIILCIVICWFLKKNPDVILKAFQIFGFIMRMIIGVTFIWMVVALFFPTNMGLDVSIIKDTIVMVVKMAISVAGALVAMSLLRRYGQKILISLEKNLKINEWSILGFLIGMPTGIAILPIYSKMDSKGKILNAAFCVSGHYMLGGQMALVAGTVSTKHFLIYLFNKILGAVLAVALALYFEKS